MDNSEKLIKYQIASLSKRNTGLFNKIFKNEDEFVLLLEEEGNYSERIPIIIGKNEAMEHAAAIQQTKTGCPLSSELMKTIIEELGYSLDKIVIDKLESRSLCAKIFLVKNNETKVVDSRPSHAIMLATRFNKKIYIMEDVIKKHKETL
jgi:uncharacterized protein